MSNTRMIYWVERESGYVAGHAANEAEAVDLMEECNRNYPSDPARVKSSPSLSALVER